MALLLVSSRHSAHHSDSRSERGELFGSTERLTLGGCWVRATLARCCLTLSSETFTNAILSLSHEYIFARLKNEGWPFLTLDKGHPGSENTQVGPALDCPEESFAILLTSLLSVFSYLSYI